METKNKKSKKKIDIGKINDFEREVKNYWEKILAGDLKLENGERFNDLNYYKKKHLKYDPGAIGGVLVAITLKSDDNKIKETCQIMYTRLACFGEDIDQVHTDKDEEPYTHENLNNNKKLSAKLFTILVSS